MIVLGRMLGRANGRARTHVLELTRDLPARNGAPSSFGEWRWHLELNQVGHLHVEVFGCRLCGHAPRSATFEIRHIFHAPNDGWKVTCLDCRRRWSQRLDKYEALL